MAQPLPTAGDDVGTSRWRLSRGGCYHHPATVTRLD